MFKKIKITIDKWYCTGPTHKSLECWMSMNEITDRGPWLFPFPICRRPPTACEAMFQHFLTGQLKGDVSAWGEMVRKDRAVSENSVEALKHFRCNTNKRSETKDIFFQMHEKVEFYFGCHFGWIDHGE